MDHGESQRVSALTLRKEESGVCLCKGKAKGIRVRMKKRISALLFVVVMMFLIFPIPVRAAETETADQEAADFLSQIKQEFSAVFENVDEETAEEVFSFLKEKVQEGNLDSEEGLLNAIEEGKAKFGVEISREDAGKLVDTMQKLEDMGFSAEYVMEKAEILYQQYGADFADHAEELLADAVKNAASNVMSSFWDNLKRSVKDFFINLFS